MADETERVAAAGPYADIVTGPNATPAAVTASTTAVATDTRNSAVGNYIPELDGLRALAIVGVLLFHLHVPGFSLGWAGVPLFFVISGFLITRILLGTRDKPFYFRNFYVRRSLRIFPIYYLTLLLVFGLLAVTGAHSRVHEILAGSSARPLALLPWYAAYLQTIPQIQTHYRELPMLSHTWSLAIEEQFYWIWPFVVAIVRRKYIPVALVCLFLAGPISRAIVMQRTTNPSYLVGTLPDQLDCLTIGGLLAWMVASNWTRSRIEKIGKGLAVAGALTLAVLIVKTGYSAFWTPPAFVWQPHNVFLFTAMALLFGGLVALCVSGSRLTRWLTMPTLMRIGRVSYGIYLYHIFVFFAVSSVFARVHRGITEDITPWRIALIVCSLAAAYLVALASWKYIEAPALALKSRFTLRPSDAAH
jgi:peptidoglycan/LPS O-acetylase OafA/YrhL